MSDVAAIAPAAPEQQEAPNVAQMIMDAPQPVWVRISAALKIKTRQEAVQLCAQDPAAASVVIQIIQSQPALTQGGKQQQQTALTTAPEAAPAAERIYGGGGKSNLSL